MQGIPARRTATGPVAATQARSAPCSRCRLATSCLPAGLAPGDVERLGDIVFPRAPLVRGQRLVRADEPLERLFIVRGGCLRTSVTTEDGREQVIGFHLPGDVVGIDPGLDRGRRSTIVALERTNLCAVAFEDLHRLGSTVPGLQEQVDRLLGHEIAGQREHLVMMGRMTAHRRLALFLRGWSGRMARAGFSEVQLPLPMSRGDIASYLGLAEETVSRAVSRLQAQGVVHVRGRHVRIVDSAGLAASAAGEPRDRTGAAARAQRQPGPAPAGVDAARGWPRR